MTNLKKAKRTTLSAQIVEQMERCIADNIWNTGEKIPGEMELMDTFGVSRNTVREAIMALVYAGILRSIPGDGTYVLNKNRLDAALQDKVKMAHLSEILETRQVIESDLVRFAAERSTTEDLVRMKKAAVARAMPELNDVEFIRKDRDFHLQIAAQSHNSLLYSMYESFLNAYYEEFLTIYLNSPQSERQHKEHDALCEAIVAKDSNMAMEIIEKLLQAERKVFLSK